MKRLFVAVSLISHCLISTDVPHKMFLPYACTGRGGKVEINTLLLIIFFMKSNVSNALHRTSVFTNVNPKYINSFFNRICI